MSNPNILGVPITRQWEDAGATLASALDKYLALCISLGRHVQKDGTPQKALAIQIDSALASLHATLEQRVAQTRSILAGTRNQVLSPISRLPNEVLLEIFSQTIFDFNRSYDPVPMEWSLVDIYRSLHNLLGVCSTWRNVALARASFWSIVPVMDGNPGKRLSTNLSLKRSGSMPLHLTAILSSPYIGVNLTEHASRFISINISSKHVIAAQLLVDQLLESGSPLKVSSLALCIEAGRTENQFPLPSGTISSLDFARPRLGKLLPSLSVLRLSGVLFRWDRVHFPHQLVELELQNINMGFDSNFVSLLTALASSTQLQTLKLISLVTIPDPVVLQSTIAKPSISFPKLQTLLARNMFFNTLGVLLSRIATRSHRLTLHLTKRTYEIAGPEEELEEAFAQDVLDLFDQAGVNTLLLEAFENEGPWLSEVDIWELLNVMPNLETLRMHDWDYRTNFCEAIQHPGVNDGSDPPRLKNMHLTQARIRDEEAFKNMVASYFTSLEHMELAGAIYEDPESMEFQLGLQGGEPLVTWLEENIPSFELTDNCEVPVEFYTSVWSL
ncbi:unnamed protein product [Rhizoctonia solani]|uniref:F-box domain-containing protein n=1 Tax=Rhizoctonia solani TaxID=456999 RepID=A0A8H3DVJ9_9AGAM|nr:unnamed protein product [Rhizoctonia solani]